MATAAKHNNTHYIYTCIYTSSFSLRVLMWPNPQGTLFRTFFYKPAFPAAAQYHALCRSQLVSEQWNLQSSAWPIVEKQKDSSEIIISLAHQTSCVEYLPCWAWGGRTGDHSLGSPVRSDLCTLPGAESLHRQQWQVLGEEIMNFHQDKKNSNYYVTWSHYNILKLHIWSHIM